MGSGIKAVLFDIDGTLLDSVDLHTESWVRTLAHFGIEAGFEDVRSHIGEGADRLLPAFLPRGTSEARKKEMEEFRAELFKREYLPKVQPFAGVRKLVTHLRAEGLRIVLASSCTAQEITDYKRIAAIADLIDGETTSDDAACSKPAPDIFRKAVESLAPISAQECIVIGDTRYDGEAARAAGVPFIGVLCGGSSEAELSQAGAIAIYKDPADLLAHWRTAEISRLAIKPKPAAADIKNAATAVS